MSAITYPIEQLAPFEVDFTRFFAEVSERVVEMRKRRRLLNLVPYEILIGKESAARQVSPPSICIVPTNFTYTHARTFQDNIDPRPLFSQWMGLDVLCWGEDDPAKLNAVHSFSSALELAREVIVALCDSNFGPAHVRVENSEWVETTSQLKTGRKLSMHVAVETLLVRDPPIIFPAAGATVNASLQSVDGTVTEPVVTFTVPPVVPS